MKITNKTKILTILTVAVLVMGALFVAIPGFISSQGVWADTAPSELQGLWRWNETLTNYEGIRGLSVDISFTFCNSNGCRIEISDRWDPGVNFLDSSSNSIIYYDGIGDEDCWVFSDIPSETDLEIDFGSSPQIVSLVFYNWFVQNATPLTSSNDISVTVNWYVDNALDYTETYSGLSSDSVPATGVNNYKLVLPLTEQGNAYYTNANYKYVSNSLTDNTNLTHAFATVTAEGATTRNLTLWLTAQTATTGTINVYYDSGYTLTYNANGGVFPDTDSTKTQWIDAGAQLGSLTAAQITALTPTRDGYVFTGWHYDAALTQHVDPADVINENKTLYASWSNTATITVNYYIDNVLSDTETITGNWENSETGHSLTINGSTVTCNKLVIESAKLFAKLNAGTLNQTISGLASGATNILAASPWMGNGASKAYVWVFSDNITTNSSGTLNLYFTPNNRTVTYNYGDGTITAGNATQTVSNGAAYSTLTPPTVSKANYIFDGWYIDSAHTLPLTASAQQTATITQDVTIYAKYAAYGTLNMTVNYYIDNVIQADKTETYNLSLAESTRGTSSNGGVTTYIYSVVLDSTSLTYYRPRCNVSSGTTVSGIDASKYTVFMSAGNLSAQHWLRFENQIDSKTVIASIYLTAKSDTIVNIPITIDGGSNSSSTTVPVIYHPVTQMYEFSTATIVSTMGGYTQLTTDTVYAKDYKVNSPWVFADGKYTLQSDSQPTNISITLTTTTFVFKNNVNETTKSFDVKLANSTLTEFLLGTVDYASATVPCATQLATALNNQNYSATVQNLNMTYKNISSADTFSVPFRTWFGLDSSYYVKSITMTNAKATVTKTIIGNIQYFKFYSHQVDNPYIEFEDRLPEVVINWTTDINELQIQISDSGFPIGSGISNTVNGVKDVIDSSKKLFTGIDSFADILPWNWNGSLVRGAVGVFFICVCLGLVVLLFSVFRRR